MSINLQTQSQCDEIRHIMFSTAEDEGRRRDERKYMGMSGIGHKCDRYIWLKFRGFKGRDTSGQAIMIFELGDMVEGQVIKWLNAAGYTVEGEQEAFTDHCGFFTGHCDGIIHGVTKEPHILEIKSANDNRFKAMRQTGVRAVSSEYYCQVQCYMGYSGHRRALFVVMNKNNCDIYVERVYYNEDDFKALRDRAKYLINLNEVPPVRKNSKCQWCEYENACFKGDFMTMSRTCRTCKNYMFENNEAFCIKEVGVFPEQYCENNSKWVKRDGF